MDKGCKRWRYFAAAAHTMGMNWDNEETLKEGENWILAVLQVNVPEHFHCLLNFHVQIQHIAA